MSSIFICTNLSRRRSCLLFVENIVAFPTSVIFAAALGGTGLKLTREGKRNSNKCQCRLIGESLSPLTGPTSSTNIGSQRKNHPLFHETIRWKSDVPLTEGQLRSKRDEFWETAPAFDGRKEIWDALRAATVAAEALDFQLAQAILDGANIFLANGYLTECYDELGSHYKIPIYCLSHPVNIVKEDHDSESPAEYSEPVDGGELSLNYRAKFATKKNVKLKNGSKERHAIS